MSFTYQVLPGLIVASLVFYDVYCSDVTANRPNSFNLTEQWPTIKRNQVFPSGNVFFGNLGQFTGWGQRPHISSVWNGNNRISWIANNTTGTKTNNTNNHHLNTGSWNENPDGIDNTANQPRRNDQTSGELTDAQLREFSEQLLSKDENNAARFVTVELQEKTTSRSERDEAPYPLLKIESEAYSIASIEKLKRLYDNYELETNRAEDNTQQEKTEVNEFIDAILSTKVMVYTKRFLIEKDLIGNDPDEFRNVLKKIWFHMYARGGRKMGSSGFEHVFLAEIKNRQVSGLHNWLYFHEEEKKNQVNYLGYMKKIDLGNKGAILKYHFTFHGIDKPVGSMFIGTSPELEMALYTTCFLSRADKICPLKLNGKKFIIRTYTYSYKGERLIGSAFPEI